MVIAIFLLIMVVIPSSIAYDVEGGENITSRVIEEDKILLRASASNDIYFDASAPAGGDGSKNNPYKTINKDRIYDFRNIITEFNPTVEFINKYKNYITSDDYNNRRV